ncbi:TATA-box-binding protein 2-like [Brevipalpus obovatus]|uniref:TATA-box-binding protein 2-like n=1 Tax=Brevipalpus obovatus TaxID=246614 RepID=UPI003D9E026F
MSDVVNIVAISRVTLSGSHDSLPQLLGLSRHRLRVKRPYIPKLKTKRSMNQFSGYFMRLENGTVTVFESGKVVSNGLKHWSDMVTVNDQFASYLMVHLPQDVDFDLELPKIVNATGCRNLEKRIDLRKFSNSDPQASYEPEIFPNLQYTFIDGERVRGIVSKNGKIIVTGVKDSNKMNLFLDKLQEKIESM